MCACVAKVNACNVLWHCTPFVSVQACVHVCAIACASLHGAACWPCHTVPGLLYAPRQSIFLYKGVAYYGMHSQSISTCAHPDAKH